MLGGRNSPGGPDESGDGGGGLRTISFPYPLTCTIEKVSYRIDSNQPVHSAKTKCKTLLLVF